MISALLSPGRKKKPPPEPRRRKSYHKDEPRERSDTESWTDSDSERRERIRRHRTSDKGSKVSREEGIRPSKNRRRSSSRDRLRTTSGGSYHSSASSSQSKRIPSMTEAPASRRTSERRPSPPHFSDSRSSLPYPKFSKAHSREAVETVPAASSPYTPDPTDAGRSTSSKDAKPQTPAWNSGVAPPSPPLTAADSHLRRVQSGSSLRMAEEGKTTGSKVKTNGDTSPTKNLRFAASQSSLSNLREAEEGKRSSNISQEQKDNQTTKGLPSPANRSPARKASDLRLRATHGGSQTAASEATEKASDHKLDGRLPTLSLQNGTRRVSRPPSPLKQVETNSDSRTQTPFIEVFNSVGTQSDTGGSIAEPFSGPSPTPPPPPPPPPDALLGSAARVDYLLQYGGLSQQIPKSFGSAHKPPPPHIYQQLTAPQTRSAEYAAVTSAFAPYHALLDKYEDVIARQGSVAVATGYTSVSRRMLERVEQTMGRNISTEVCSCAMCDSDRSLHKAMDVSWGEILELVSGRVELPQWPPFVMPTTSTGLGLSGLEQEAPMQKLDIDVPEEYRDHYIRQSRKTKQSVDKWLASQPEDGATPPTEVDDGTLSFAMLTYLEPTQRRTFTALIRGLPSIAEARSPVPESPVAESAVAESHLMDKVSISLQRLYRLQSPPRKPECAMFMLKNPDLHGVLAILASISAPEWDLLLSGRFDGLLAGAENGSALTPRVPSRSSTPVQKVPISRGPTPFRNTPSRGAASTPHRGASQNGTSPAEAAPIQADEDVEIAVLAEVEREIFQGMEALENGLEALHVQAERVRTALMDRAAGLNRQAQNRRAGGEELRAVLGTPFDGDGVEWIGSPATPASRTMGNGFGSEDDNESLLYPDDSASNVGWRERSKQPRHRKRRSRRTPAPVEEEDE